MSEPTFFILFGVTWLFAMAYGLSAFRLLTRVRGLKAAGPGRRCAGPPDQSAGDRRLHRLAADGRYAGLGDDVATRWAGIARVLFIVALPLILAVFAIALTQAGGWSQPI